MLDLNKVEINVSDQTVQSVTGYIKNIWYGAPGWLRALLCVSVICGALYFLYNRIDTASRVDELRAEIQKLNQSCEKAVFLDRYAYDISNFINVAKAMDQEVQTLYEINQQILEMEDEYISRNRPGDPSLFTIKRLKKQNDFSKESFDKVIQHNMEMYEKWLETIKNNETDDDYSWLNPESKPNKGKK